MSLRSRLALVSLAIVLAAGPAGSAAEPPVQADVFVSGKEGYHTFRIPALIVTSKGTLLVFGEGRKTSRADHDAAQRGRPGAGVGAKQRGGGTASTATATATPMWTTATWPCS
jgi:hypothetical protein